MSMHPAVKSTLGYIILALVLIVTVAMVVVVTHRHFVKPRRSLRRARGFITPYGRRRIGQ